MPTEEIIPPEPHLMQSMRAVGYTLEAAIADLVDNSVTAGARKIEIFFTSEPNDYLAVLDDGRGMTREMAREAMRLAGRDPGTQRSETDLGRFGLGLKTASLSQCRDLTVITKTVDGPLIGYSWNLDQLAVTGRWSLFALDEEDVNQLPGVPILRERPSGTLVLWRELDQLRAHAGTTGSDFDSAMDRVKTHLGLVFHRFLQERKPLSITINGVRVPHIDPFLSNHPRTQRLPEETFTIEDSIINILPYTVPRISTVSKTERRMLEAPGALRDSQGFYIYRARRLVIWGTWFRIQPRQDMAKLSRIQVDVPNSLDHLWSLDIKKASAQPPPPVRARLKKFAEQVTRPSRATLTYQGRKEDSSKQHVWSVRVSEDAFSYELNRSHPALQKLQEAMSGHGEPELRRLLELIENTLPGDDIFNRLAKDEVLRQTIDNTTLSEMASDMWALFKDNAGTTADAAGFIRAMSLVEPFCNDPKGVSILTEATHE